MRGAVRWLIFLAVLALPRTAAAALMHSYDVASLAFDAHEIVLVEKVKHWELKAQLREFETVRVKRVYAGSELEPGTEITIETSCYGFEPMFGWDPTKPKPAVSDERILFLSPRKGNSWDAPGAPAMSWGLESSGMRIFIDGHVNRFEQEMNPGCYGPVPGEGPKNAAYTLPEFEQALAAAIATATEAHAFLAAPPAPERTAKLLAIIGPSVRREPAWRDRDFGLDRIATTILEDFATAGDIPALLEGTTRTRRVDLFMSRLDVPPARLINAARSTLPVRQRVAALTLLTYGSALTARVPGIGDAFTALLSDPAPELRLAALGARFPNDATPQTYLDALVAQFRNEKDPRVRVGLLRRALNEHVANRLTIPASELPLARGSQDDGTIAVVWAVPDGEAGEAKSVVIELRKDGALVAREAVPRGYSISNDITDVAIELADVTAPPGIAAGVYDVFVDLEIATEGHPAVARRLSIGPMDLDARAVVPFAQAATKPTPSSRAPEVVPSPIVDRARKFASHPGPRILAAALFGLFLGLFVVRRRRKSRYAQ